MALLTNINGKFSVSDAGAVTFNNAFTFPTADGNANYVLQTNGSGQIGWAENGSVTGSGSATRVAFWSSGSAITSDADLYWVNTNKRLGIGTDSPDGKFHVYSAAAHNNIYFTGGDVAGTGYDVNLYVNGGANNSEMAINMGIAGNADRDRIKTYQGNMYFRTNDSERVIINSSGNVGIGTTLPTTALTIRKAIPAAASSYGLQASMVEFKSYYPGYDTETVKSAIYSGVSDQTTLQTTKGYMSFWTADEVAGGGESLTEKMRIESNGDVGIGETSPSEKLEVAGNILCSGAFLRTSTSGDAWFSNGNDSTYTQTRLYVNQNNTSNNDANGYFFERGRLTNTASAEIRRWVIGARGGQKQMMLDGPGSLTVAGDVVAYGSPSDIRLKENIKPIKSALDKVIKLQGVTFDWKESDSILDIKEDIGFIAQDVQKVIPELVRENKDGMLSMRHQGIAPILLEAIKELKAEIEELKLNKCNCNCNK